MDDGHDSTQLNHALRRCRGPSGLPVWIHLIARGSHATASIHRIRGIISGIFSDIFSSIFSPGPRHRYALEVSWLVLGRAKQAVPAGGSLYAWSRAEMARKELVVDRASAGH